MESWDVFKKKLQAYLRTFGLEKAIANSVQELVDNDHTEGKKPEKREKWEEKASKAYGIIISCLDDNTMNVVMNEEDGNAKATWDALVKRYERVTKASMSEMREELLSIKMKDNEEFEDYYARLNIVISKLGVQGVKMDESEKVFYMLRGITGGEYEAAKTFIESDKSMTIQDACVMLRDKQMQIKRNKKVNDSDDDNKSNDNA